ncbi:MAG: glycosyltransferase [Carboxylicivirga sp.]|jgi:glycosyltransferase involved in cell wall biosynthesis|nr:glycosyltransferase [Carboxylicivirga sp.]
MSYLQEANHFLLDEEYESSLVFGETEIKDPLISILIPSFNRPEYLERAIASALDQREASEFEIIVVDNCSDDDYFNEIKKRVGKREYTRYYRNEANLGMVGNWNRCINLAKGKWVTFLHDDDVLSPYYVFTMRKLIEEIKDAELIAPDAYFGSKISSDLYTKPENFDLSKSGKRISLRDMIYGNIVPTQGTLVSRQAMINIGGFSKQDFPIMDYALWCKFINRNKSYKVKIKVFHYWIGENESLNRNTFEQILVKERELIRELGQLCHSNKMFLWLHMHSLSATKIVRYGQKVSKDIQIRDFKNVISVFPLFWNGFLSRAVQALIRRFKLI